MAGRARGFEGLRWLALVGTLLCGCELVAGYDDLKPRPGEAGVDDLDAGPDALDAGNEDADTPGDLDADPAALDGASPDLDARGAADATPGDGPDVGEPVIDGASGPDASGPDAGQPDAGQPDAGSCALPSGQDLCTALPRFSAQQVVDGRGDEFCGIAAMVFDVVDCPTLKPSTPPPLPGRVEVRAAWSNEALHVHVHVIDPTIIVQTDRARLWNGDAVEIYIAGASGNQLSGGYDGTNDGGAIQLVLAPPSGAFAARGEAIFSPTGLQHAPIDESLYAGRVVADGYELELRYPWVSSALAAVAARRVAFDFAIDVQDSVSAGGRQLQCVISDVSVDGSDFCGLPAGTPAEPYCDDRTWCQPQLSL